MPRGPVLSIKLNAGTTEFFADIEKANAKIVQFGKSAENAGHGAVSGMQATSASLRVLEGGITNNLRAAERFAANVLNLGPILQAAFPVIGGIAFLGLLSKLGEEVKKFYTEMRDAPEKMAGAFRQLNTEAALSNAELQKSLDGINNEIAKLEGKRPNALKEMLDDANLSAIKLDQSLNNAFEKLAAKFKDNKVSAAWGLLTGQKSTYNPEFMAGGLTGSAGIQEKLAAISEESLAKLQQTHTLEQANAVLKEKAAAQQALLNKELTDANRLLKEDENIQKGLQASGQSFHPGVIGLGGGHVDTSADIKQLKEYILMLESKKKTIDIVAETEIAAQRRTELQANKDAARPERPYEKKMEELRAQLKGVGAEINAVGQSEGAQILAKAFGESEKAIAEIDSRIHALYPALHILPEQAKAIREAFKDIATAQIELGWKERVEQTTDSLRSQTRAQELLAAAIGHGYEAVKKANVEIKVMEAVKPENYFKPGFLDEHAAEVEKLRFAASNDYEAKHSTQVASATDKLNDQIELEKELVTVQSRGAEAVRQAALAVRQRQEASIGATKEQLDAERDLYDAQWQNLSGEEVAELDEKTAATLRLAAATIKGADAVRQANIENRVAEARREGDRGQPIPGALGVGEYQGGPVEGAIRKQGDAEHDLQVSQAAVQADRVQAIDEQIKKLNEAKATLGDTLAIEIQLRTLENERIQALAQESLGMRSARDGVRAFFIEMQEDAKSAAQIVYDSLNSALDKVSANLAHLFTGKKTDWAKAFQDIGGEMVQSTIKSTLQKGLGALGQKFGVGIGGAEPDGTRGNPLWVQMAGAGTGGASPGWPQFGIPGSGSNSSDSDSGGDSGSGGAIFSGVGNMISHLFGGGRASGGSVDPGTAYMVGENGPEMFMPSTRGTIVPHGAGGGSVQYIIDARGADLGAYNRIARGMAMTHDKAVAHAVQAQHERGKRTPRQVVLRPYGMDHYKPLKRNKVTPINRQAKEPCYLPAEDELDLGQNFDSAITILRRENSAIAAVGMRNRGTEREHVAVVCVVGEDAVKEVLAAIERVMDRRDKRL